MDFWIGGLLAFSLPGTLIIYFFLKNKRDRFLLIFCFIALVTVALFLTGANNYANYERMSFWFVAPSTIFIISSIILIINNFKKKPLQKKN